MTLQWNEDEERILSVLSDKCFAMSEHHKKCFLRLQSHLKYYKIPIIIISGVNSVIAVGMDGYLPQSVISATNCLLALTCGIIGSIELYLKITDNMNVELECGRDFYILHIELKKTLTLPRQFRGVSGNTYLESNFNRYLKMISKAQVVTGRQAEHIFDESITNDSVDSKSLSGSIISRIYDKVKKYPQKTRSTLDITKNKNKEIQFVNNINSQHNINIETLTPLSSQTDESIEPLKLSTENPEYLPSSTQNMKSNNKHEDDELIIQPKQHN